jgi:hypothetical protein
VVSHAPANALAPPSRTAVPAGGFTARLGNLVDGQEYEATAVGTCADGTKTPPSAPVRFVAAPPPCCGCLAVDSAVAGEIYNEGTRSSIAIALSGARPGQSITCWASNVEAVVASWASWGGVLASPAAPCNGTACVEDQTMVTAGVADGAGTAQLIATMFIDDDTVDVTNVTVVCAAAAAGGDAGACGAAPPSVTVVGVQKECLPADATVQRVDPDTGSASSARMDELYIGDHVECLVPQHDGSAETGYEHSVCQVYYYLNKGSSQFEYVFFTYALRGGGQGVLRATPMHHVFVAAAAAAAPAAAPPPGRARLAAEVQAGDLLAVQDPATGLFYTTPVTALRRGVDVGAYTPLLTRGGLLVVDGVVAYAAAGPAAPLSHAFSHALHLPVWQAFQEGAAAGCTGAACPCLDARCVRQGDRLRDLPDGLASWYAAEYAPAVKKAAQQGRSMVDRRGLIGGVAAAAAAAGGGGVSRAAALRLFDAYMVSP